MSSTVDEQLLFTFYSQGRKRNSNSNEGWRIEQGLFWNPLFRSFDNSLTYNGKVMAYMRMMVNSWWALQHFSVVKCQRHSLLVVQTNKELPAFLKLRLLYCVSDFMHWIVPRSTLEKNAEPGENYSNKTLFDCFCIMLYDPSTTKLFYQM